MVRTFGSVAAVVTAALAIVIGVLAYNANNNEAPARPPSGGQVGAPPEVRSVAGIPRAQPPELTTGGGGQEPVSSSAGGGRPAANAPMHATFSGGGGHVVAAPTPVHAGCGLLGTVVSLLGGLLGGGGGC